MATPSDTESMSSAAGSPARTSVLLVAGPVSKESVPACGPSTPASLATFDPDTSSWRTAQLSLFEDSDECSVIWQDSGSMRNGRSFPLAGWVPHTCEKGCSSWPTMRRFDRYGISKRTPGLPGTTGGGCSNLSERVGGLPNPQWAEWLMGFPQRWTEIESGHSETQSSPKSPSGSDAG